MPIPVLPVVATSIASLLVGGLVGNAVGVRSTAARKQLRFIDRGWSVTIAPDDDDDGWRWSATKENKTPGEGDADSMIAALDDARSWVSARRLPPANTNRGKLPRSKPEGPLVDPRKVAPVSPTPVPVAPPTPVPPIPPVPVGGGGPVATPIPPQPLEGLGIRWEPSDNTIVLLSHTDFLASVWGASDPFIDPPRVVLENALRTALPKLDLVAYGGGLQVTSTQGNRFSLDEVEKRIANVQVQLLDPGVPPEALPFAADLLHEQIFNEEQRQSRTPLAFRGRVLHARPVPGGYISTIVSDGETVNGTVVVGDVATAIELGIETVSEEDGV